MKNYSSRRFRIARLLLLVYIPMMIAVSLHHHGEAHHIDAAVHCEYCLHHIHHSGHIQPSQHPMHDCVLCQLQSTVYLAPALFVWNAMSELHRIVRHTGCRICMARAHDVKSTRAPPYIIYRLSCIN